MNVLLLGGSRFVGRHITDALLARGDTVAHFNRGKSNPSGRADVQTIHGDRATDLERIGNRTWDAVIDTSGYTPDVVERSARYFAERANRYLFVSTISVYDETRTSGPDEDAPLHALPDGVDPSVFNAEYYGALKALCENVVRSTFRQRAAIVRLGLVAGPYDHTDRFTYWPVRVATGGEVLAPVSASEPLQYIDVRDLAAFAVHIIRHGASGTYNCVTPRGALHFGDLLDACSRAARLQASVTWVDADFLKEHGVEPWSDLPLWIPQGDPYRGITSADSTRAFGAGLRVRPVLETVRDTLDWARASGKRLEALESGLKAEREAALLDEFRRRLTAAVK